MDLYKLNNIEFIFPSNQGLYREYLTTIYVGNIPRSDPSSRLIKNKLPSILGLDFLEKSGLKFFFNLSDKNVFMTDESIIEPLIGVTSREINKIILTDNYTIKSHIEDCLSCLNESINNIIIIEGSGYQISKVVDATEILKSRIANLSTKIEIDTIRENGNNRSIIKSFITRGNSLENISSRIISL
ncbi:MAG TPA: hypothetical protein VMV49_07740 [Candidatus Deferrimicrobium sp.]|nr:hypothetical protein [Candidatus Deferrimicrobium sp.]